MGRIEYALVALPDNTYTEDAADALAGIFDIGVNNCGLSGEQVSHAFVSSGMAEQFEKCNPKFVAGKSGTELVELLLEYMQIELRLSAYTEFDRTPQYWLGWSLAHYQSETGRLYKSIFNLFGYERLLNMYWPLHEAPLSKFYQTLEDAFREPSRPTRLKMQREAACISQSQLAKQSGVGLRSIQMYEQRNKNIDNASAATLVKLSRALSCEITDLMEAL